MADDGWPAGLRPLGTLPEGMRRPAHPEGLCLMAYTAPLGHPTFPLIPLRCSLAVAGPAVSARATVAKANVDVRSAERVTPDAVGNSGESGSGSALGALVGAVIGVGPQKQMVWPHARRVVAAVANHHACRDRAVSELPTEAVGVDLDLLARFGSKAESSVAARQPTTNPQPAVRAAVDLLPEPIIHRSDWWASPHGYQFRPVRKPS